MLSNDARIDKRLLAAEAEIRKAKADAASMQNPREILDAVVKYSDDRIAYESLENTPRFKVSAAVAGDDSLDVVDSSALAAGRYFIFEGEREEIIEVREVLTANRVVPASALSNTFSSAAIVSRRSGGRLIAKHPGSIIEIYPEGATPIIEVDVYARGDWRPLDAARNFRTPGPAVFRVATTGGVLNGVVLVDAAVGRGVIKATAGLLNHERAVQGPIDRLTFKKPVQVPDLTTIDASLKDFFGGVFDGSRVYAIPSGDGSPHGKLVRVVVNAGL